VYCWLDLPYKLLTSLPARWSLSCCLEIHDAIENIQGTLCRLRWQLNAINDSLCPARTSLKRVCVTNTLLEYLSLSPIERISVQSVKKWGREACWSGNANRGSHPGSSFQHVVPRSVSRNGSYNHLGRIWTNACRRSAGTVPPARTLLFVHAGFVYMLAFIVRAACVC
jgi:hypothetical protein